MKSQSGPRHHILPRFLLKGFASQSRGKTVFTWLFRRGQKPREESIQNINISKHFYGREGEPFPDPQITEVEPGFAIFIEGLRKSNQTYQITDHTVIEFVAHISMRTKNIRDSMHSLVETVGEGIAEHMSSNKMKEAIITHVQNSVLNGYEKTAPHFSAQAMSILRGEVSKEFDKLLKGKDVDLKPEMESILNDFPIREKIRQGHNELISKDVIPQEIVQIYEKLNWYVVSTDEALVLSDSGMIIETSTKRRFKSVDFINENIVNCFLPIASNRIIVGTVFNVLPGFKVKTLNSAMIKCAFDFFIFHENSPEEEGLTNKIGEWAGIVPKEELQRDTEDMFDDLIAELLNKCDK